MKKRCLLLGLFALLFLLEPALSQPSSSAVPKGLLLNTYLEVSLSSYNGNMEITFFLFNPAFFYTEGLKRYWFMVDGQRVYINSTLFLEYRNGSYTSPPASLLLEPGLYKVRLEYSGERVNGYIYLVFSFNATITVDSYGFILETDFPIRVYDVKLERGYISGMTITMENPTSVRILSSPSEVVIKCPNLYEEGCIFLWARALPYVSVRAPPPRPCTVRLASLLMSSVPFDAFASSFWNVTYPDGYSELVTIPPSLILPGTVIRNATPIAGIRDVRDYITLDYIKEKQTFAEVCNAIVGESFSYRLERGKCNLTLIEVVVAGRLNREGIRALDEEYVYVLRTWRTITVVTPHVFLAAPLPVKVLFDTTNLSHVSLLVPVVEKNVVLPGVLQIHRNLTVSSSLFPVSAKVVGEELLINVSIPYRFFVYSEKSFRLYVVGSERGSIQPLAPLLLKVTVESPSVLVGEGRPLVRVEREGGGALSFVASSRNASKWGFSASGGSYVMTLAAKLTVLSKSGGIPLSAEVVVEENGRVVAGGKGTLVEFFLEPGKTYTVYVSYAGTTLTRIVSLNDDTCIEAIFPTMALFFSVSPLLALIALLLVIIMMLAVRHSMLGRRRFVKLK